MDNINPMSSGGNLVPKHHEIKDTEQKPQEQKDSVEVMWKPGGMVCYMYSKMKDQEGADPKVLSQHRTEAINKALNDGTITLEMAQKLLKE